MLSRLHAASLCGLLVVGCGGSGSGGGEDGCAGDVCLPTDGGSAGTQGDGTASGDGDTTDSDGMCDPSTCEPWAVNDPPDGTAVRTCGDNDCTDLMAALPSLDENYYRCRVQPILEQGCGLLGCHSLETPARAFKMYARWHSREAPIHSGSQDIESPTICENGIPRGATCARHPLTALEWAYNFDSARLFALNLANSTESELLTQPLTADPLGHEHDGLDLWASTNDVRHGAILQWLDGGTEAPDCNGLVLPDQAGNLAFDWNSFMCPDCSTAPGPNNCTPSGEGAAPCDPNVCIP